MTSCAHTAEYGYDWLCFDCTPNTPEGDKLRSVGFRFVGGRDGFRDGPTLRETEKAMIEGAKRAGNEPPERIGGFASGGPGRKALNGG